mmetsp:Transcript_130019/g.324046  ORF Transcript_130019/g.324046 Transcript_130019/m.324046 type:complete len:286 (-) Transcript_130019:9-866(-)
MQDCDKPALQCCERRSRFRFLLAIEREGPHLHGPRNFSQAQFCRQTFGLGVNVHNPFRHLDHRPIRESPLALQIPIQNSFLEEDTGERDVDNLVAVIQQCYDRIHAGQPMLTYIHRSQALHVNFHVVDTIVPCLLPLEILRKIYDVLQSMEEGPDVTLQPIDQETIAVSKGIALLFLLYPCALSHGPGQLLLALQADLHFSDILSPSSCSCASLRKFARVQLLQLPTHRPHCIRDPLVVVDYSPQRRRVDRHGAPRRARGPRRAACSSSRACAPRGMKDTARNQQ